MFECCKKMKPWMTDGILGFLAGLGLYSLRVAGITIPYLSDWNSANLSLGWVGVTMIVAYTIAGLFIGELVTQVTGKKRN